MKKLEIDNRPEFSEKFIEIAKEISLEELADLVWQLANEQWEKGYNQGYHNPDFDN